MDYGLLLENWRMRLIMTKSEIEELIQELERIEKECLVEAERLAEEGSDGGADYEFGFVDGMTVCIEIVKGRSGFYD